MDLCSCTGRTFLVNLQGESNLAYETYRTRILFFERYVRTQYANVFYFSVGVSSSLLGYTAAQLTGGRFYISSRLLKHVTAT